MFSELKSPVALDFLARYSTPEALSGLTAAAWEEFAREHRLGKGRAAELWGQLKAPQVAVPAHVVRAKARLVGVLAAGLEVARTGLADYKAEIERFFASMPAAETARSLPGGKTGTVIPTIWAELGGAAGRW